MPKSNSTPRRVPGSRIASAPSGPARRSLDAYYIWGVCGCLLLAIWLIYDQTRSYPFLAYDDNPFVFNNPHVAPGLTLDGIRWAFTDGPFGEWYPLAMLSHMLDCQLFGLDAWGHHLTNVLLHAAASIALFLVWRRYTGELWPSALVAAVFAVHPQHVESVAWVAERRDVLSGLFFVLTLGAWLGYLRHGRKPLRYALAAALFALGLMSKATIVTLPALLLLLDFWPLSRFGATNVTSVSTRPDERPTLWRLVLEKLPLAALSVGASLVTLRTHASEYVAPPASLRFGSAVVSCVSYIADFFWPVDLVAYYPFPSDGLPLWKVFGAGAMLLAVSATAVLWRRRYPYFFVGWYWYLGMLFPLLGAVKIGTLARADRYMYLPGIGLSIALVWAGARLAARSAEGRWALAACAAVAIALLVGCAVRQTSFWRDDETLWRHALACIQANGKAEFCLGEALARNGYIEEAIVFYRRAQQHPVDSGPFGNLGVIFASQGRSDEAIEQYRQALEMQPGLYATHVNLAVELLRRKELDEAREHFRQALKISPLGVEAHCGLAHLLLREEEIDAARDEFERAIAINPRFVIAHVDLADTLLKQGKIDESIRHSSAALAIDPKFVLAHVNLARALAAAGQTEEAADHFSQALTIDPHNAAARKGLDALHQGVP